jgi:hypothetical protein
MLGRACACLSNTAGRATAHKVMVLRRSQGNLIIKESSLSPGNCYDCLLSGPVRSCQVNDIKVWDRCRCRCLGGHSMTATNTPRSCNRLWPLRLLAECALCPACFTLPSIMTKDAAMLIYKVACVGVTSSSPQAFHPPMLGLQVSSAPSLPEHLGPGLMPPARPVAGEANQPRPPACLPQGVTSPPQEQSGRCTCDMRKQAVT